MSDFVNLKDHLLILLVLFDREFFFFFNDRSDAILPQLDFLDDVLNKIGQHIV